MNNRAASSAVSAYSAVIHPHTYVMGVGVHPAVGGVYYLHAAFILAASGEVFCGQIIKRELTW